MSTEVGTSSGHCNAESLLTPGGYAYCALTVVLDCGKINIIGASEVGPPSEYSISGGTGYYCGATGVDTSVASDDPDQVGVFYYQIDLY